MGSPLIVKVNPGLCGLHKLSNRVVALRDWAQDLQARRAKDEQRNQVASGAYVATAHTKIQSLQSKLQRLLDGYLDQDIDRETYTNKKAELMSEKKSLEEQSAKRTLTIVVGSNHSKNGLQRLPTSVISLSPKT